jgi:hypothetical protein
MRKVVVLSLALAACSQPKPAMPQLLLQPILYPDITQNKLYGPACNFVPANGGLGAVFMAQDTSGMIKIDDHVVTIPLAADAAPLAPGAHTRYAGPLYAATLVLAPGAKQTTRGADILFTGHLTITDAKRQTVYDATGDTQCRPG